MTDYSYSERAASERASEPQGWETEADARDAASWAPEPTLAERAAAYRADEFRSYRPERMHPDARLFSPGFQLLGIVNTHHLPSNPYSSRYHDFTRSGHPIFLPLDWMHHRGGPGTEERNQNMTIRWRRI